MPSQLRSCRFLGTRTPQSKSFAHCQGSDWVRKEAEVLRQGKNAVSVNSECPSSSLLRRPCNLNPLLTHILGPHPVKTWAALWRI